MKILISLLLMSISFNVALPQGWFTQSNGSSNTITEIYFVNENFDLMKKIENLRIPYQAISKSEMTKLVNCIMDNPMNVLEMEAIPLIVSVVKGTLFFISAYPKPLAKTILSFLTIETENPGMIL